MGALSKAQKIENHVKEHYAVGEKFTAARIVEEMSDKRFRLNPFIVGNYLKRFDFITHDEIRNGVYIYYRIR